MADHSTPSQERRGGNAEAAVGEEIAGAESDTVVYITDVVQHGTARLPELHGLESTWNRHPFFHATHGEPPSGLSLPPNLTIGHGAPHLERVGQCLVFGR